MTIQRRKSSSAIAVFLAFALVQVCIQLGFAAPASPSAPVAVPQQFIARLSSSGSVTVNGASASSGASLLTGATIETPLGVNATIDLGALGTVELGPGSSIQLDFADDGSVRVKVLSGCVKVNKKGPGEAEAYTAEGSSEKTNSSNKKLGFCFANGGLSPIGQAAATASGGGGGLGAGATAAIVIAAIAVPATLYFALRDDGGNPSPSAP